MTIKLTNKIQVYKLSCPPYNWVVACQFCKAVLGNHPPEGLLASEVEKLYQQKVHYPKCHNTWIN